MNIFGSSQEFGSAQQQEQNQSILIDENTRRKSLGELRSLELNAYNHLLSALRAAGGLDEEKRQVMRVVREQLSIPDERHRAELRRVACDKKLGFIADTVSGSNLTDVKWFDEGREKFSELKIRRKYNAITSSNPEKIYREHKDYYPLLLNDLLSHKLNQKEKDLNDYFHKQQLGSTKSILKQRKSNLNHDHDTDNERETIKEEIIVDDQFQKIIDKVNVQVVEDVDVDVLACQKKFAKKLINARRMKEGRDILSTSSSSSDSSSDEVSATPAKISHVNKVGKNSTDGKGKVKSCEVKRKKVFQVKEKQLQLQSPLYRPHTSIAGSGPKKDSGKKEDSGVGEENAGKRLTTIGNHPQEKRRKGFSNSNSKVNQDDKTRSIDQNDKYKSPTRSLDTINKNTSEVEKIHRKIKGTSNRGKGSSSTSSKGFNSTTITSMKTSMKSNTNKTNIPLSSPTRKTNASPDITDTFKSRHKLSEEIPKGVKRQLLIKRASPIKRKITGDIVKKRFAKIKTHTQQQLATKQLELEEGEIILQNYNTTKLKSNENIPITIMDNQNKVEEPPTPTPSVPTPKKSRRKSILTGRKMKAPPEDIEQQGDFNNGGVSGRKNKRKSKNIKLSDDFDIMMEPQMSEGRLSKRKVKRPQVFMDFDLMDKDFLSSSSSISASSTAHNTNTSNTNIQNQHLLNLKERKSPRKSQVSPQVYKSDFTYSSLSAPSVSNPVVPEPPPQPTPVANYFSNTGLNVSSTNQYLRTSSNSIINTPADYYSTSYISRKIQQQQKQQLKSSLANSSSAIQQSLVGSPQYKFITESIQQQPKTFSTIHLPNNLSATQSPTLQKMVPIMSSTTTTTPTIIQQQSSSAGGSNSNSNINQNNATTNSPATPATNNPPRKPHILSTAKLANRQIQGVSGNGSNTTSTFNNQQSIPIQLRTMQQGQHNIIFLQKSATPMTSDDHQKTLDNSGTTTSIINSGNPPPPHQRAVILRRANLNRPGVMVFNNNNNVSTSGSSPLTLSNSLSASSAANTAFKSFNSQNLPLIQSGLQQNILKKTLTSNISAPTTKASAAVVSSKESHVDSSDPSASFNLYSSGNTNTNTNISTRIEENSSSSQNRQQPNEMEGGKGKDFLAESLLKSNILEMDDFNQPGKNIHFQIINSPKNTKVITNDAPAPERFLESSKPLTIDKNSELHSYLISNPENPSSFRNDYGEEVVQTEEIKFSS